MASLPEEDRRQRILREAFEHWQRMGSARRSGAKLDEEREDDLIGQMLPWVGEEIVAVVKEDRVARVLLGLWYVADLTTGEESVCGDDDTVIREGIRWAGRTYIKNRHKRVTDHVKECVAAKLVRLRNKRIAEVQNKTPEELLPDVINWPRPNAAVLLDHLTFKQREALLLLLIAQTPKKSVDISLGEEPEDELLWRIWYTAVLQAVHPAIRGILEKTDRPTITLLGEGWGKPLPEGKSAAAPLHASYYLQLAAELKKRRYAIKRHESRRRIVRLQGKSRSTIDRYLASGAHAELLALVGNRATVRFTFEDIQRSIDAVRGEKRGPKNDS